MAKGTYARLGTFARGVAYGLFLAGWALRDIASTVKKHDGRKPTHEAVRGALNEVKDAPPWGADKPKKHPGGVRRTTTPALDKQIRKLVWQKRGKVQLTVKTAEKQLKAARKVSDRTIARRLVEAGLAWMRRRRKTILTKEHREQRLSWVAWVLRRQASTLCQWAFTDGTTLYLARSDTETVRRQTEAHSAQSNQSRAEREGDRRPHRRRTARAIA